MRRKLVIIAVSVVAAALIAVAALPWWLGAALGVVGGRYGVTFDNYRRMGYGRFALEGVRVRTNGVEVKVTRIEASTPLIWIAGTPKEIVVDDWNVVVAKSEKHGPSGQHCWLSLRSQLAKIMAPIEKWLPSATARSGVVEWDGGRLDFGKTTWSEGGLAVGELRWRELSARVDVKHETAAQRWSVSATGIADEWGSEWVSEGTGISGRGNWHGQPWTATAVFAPTGWLPEDARVEAKGWSVPGARLKLGGFYASVNGAVSVIWKDRALLVDMQAAGVPVEGKDAPPLQLTLHGSGGVDRLSIDRLELLIPGVTGTLSEPISLGPDGRLLSGASRFELTADLAKQPWFKGSGRVTGSVKVTPRDSGVPVLAATLTGTDAVVADWKATKADVAVRVEWPQVSITTANVELAGGDRLTLGCSWNADTHTLADAKLNGQVSRATAARWLPDDADFEKVTVDVKAEGVWPAIHHEGRLDAEALRIAPLKPLSGDAVWHGTGGVISDATINARAGGTQVRAVGSADSLSAWVKELVLTQGGEERLRLARATRVEWSPALKIDPVEFTGTDSRLSGRIDWVEHGGVEASVRNFQSVWLRDLFVIPGPEWTLSNFDVKGAWDKGPLVFTTTGAATVRLSEGRQAELALSAHGDADGVVVETLNATMQERPVVRVSGKVPVVVWPWSDRRVRIDEDAALAIDAVTESHAVFWEQLSQISGLVLTAPDVNLKFTGTIKKPTGEGRINIAKIAPGGAAWARSLPEITDLTALLTGDRGGLALETFTAKVSGQTVRASGRLPVKDWAALADKPLTLAAAEGEARIEIPDADVAALARYAPAYLSPTGKLNVDVSLKPGGKLYGTIRLTDAATRPLGPLGILQSIGAEIALDGRTVIFKDVHAKAGGQPVVLTGTASLAEDKVPRLDLALKGDNLPFVRQAGLLVRGDLDLKIKTGDDDVTRITGGTRLRDSLFLMDVRALLPSGGARNAPGRRPPYFSVEVAPFNAWVLDVTVAGDRFLRLRTPVFNGVASANLKLSGTLGDPRVTGEAVVNQGQVLLPFATFLVRQGRVRITAQDPFEPRIALTGTSRRYGYDLRMEITGTTDKPELTFSSTPSLESEQVLLMVMAGETPQNEINYTGRERAARLGAYLGQSLLGQLGADQAAADKLTIDVGERISRQGRETYDVEYELDKRWSLVGEYDEFDEYNLGVKWRIFAEKPKQKPEATDAK
jgi:translocation and assembly module TamB